jgi:hypothetical protein
MLRFKEYVEIKAEHWSTLKHMGVSPLHYKHARENPTEDTVTLACGRGIHTALLEPEKFDDEYVIFPGKTRRGKEWDAFKIEHANRTILKAAERDRVLAAADAVRKHPDVQAFMRNGVAEQSVKWVDEESGLTCKSRIDWLGEVLFDLKSTSEVDQRKFGNLAARMLYHGQVGMYSDGAAHRGPVYLVAVEAEAPHDVAVFRVTDDALFTGRELYRDLLKKVAACNTSGVWPGRFPGVVDLELPAYVYEDDQDDGTSVVVDDDEEAA